MAELKHRDPDVASLGAAGLHAFTGVAELKPHEDRPMTTDDLAGLHAFTGVAELKRARPVRPPVADSPALSTPSPAWPN